MAAYRDHLNQVRSNLQFLTIINDNCLNHTDWQVTTCFYVGVHLVNGFLAQESNLHFNSHERVKEAIAPESINVATRLDEPTYLAYSKLRNLSRRSRYLCNSDNPASDIERAHFILEKHYLRAFENLDTLMKFFNKKYGESYAVTQISFPFSGPTPTCVYFKFLTRAA
jgi:hypothetical protein